MMGWMSTHENIELNICGDSCEYIYVYGIERERKGKKETECVCVFKYICVYQCVFMTLTV